MSEFIIDRPSSLRTHERLTGMGVTILFWGALVYMWQPLISMVAWAFKIKLFYNHMVVLGGYASFIDLTVIYISVILALSAIFLGWARINQWRFQGKEKRTSQKNVINEVLSRDFNVNLFELELWQLEKNISLQLDEKGYITGVKPRQIQGKDNRESTSVLEKEEL